MALARLVLALTAVAGWAPAAAQTAGSCDPSSRWSELIIDHVDRYPLLELPDLYKLLHQATMGSEHEVSRGDARGFLEREMSDLGEGPEVLPTDRLGGGGRFARVHLRPYLAAGGDPDRLLDAFVRTANLPAHGVGELECAAAIATALAATARLPWSTWAVGRYMNDRAAESFPAVHHSDAFREAYAPAYRVVAVELLERLEIPPEPH